MKIKTSELEGAALDWAVAQIDKEHPMDVDWRMVDGEALGFGSIGSSPEFACYRLNVPTRHFSGITIYSPSTDWSQGGQIIESEEIYLSPPCMVQDGLWQAQCWMPYAESFAPTPLIAAMRVIVASKLGDTVDVPDELL